MMLFYSTKRQKNSKNGEIKNLFTAIALFFGRLIKLKRHDMDKRPARYDTRESVMEALKELVALQVLAEDVAPVLCTIGPVDLDLLDDCMDAIGLNDNRSVAA